MEEAEKELERRSKFLNSLILNKKKKKSTEHQQQDDKNNIKLNNSIHVKACDMSLPLQKHAFQFARDHLDSMPSKKPDSKHLALSLKKVTLLSLFFSKICFWLVIFDPWFVVLCWKLFWLGLSLNVWYFMFLCLVIHLEVTDWFYMFGCSRVEIQNWF